MLFPQTVWEGDLPSVGGCQHTSTQSGWHCKDRPRDLVTPLHKVPLASRKWSLDFNKSGINFIWHPQALLELGNKNCDYHWRLWVTHKDWATFSWQKNPRGTQEESQTWICSGGKHCVARVFMAIVGRSTVLWNREIPYEPKKPWWIAVRHFCFPLIWACVDTDVFSWNCSETTWEI